MALFALALLLASCAPAGKPHLNEVLYDAVGDDTGYEFVELYNPGTAPYALAGLEVQAGDGAGPGRWSTKWTAGARDTIAAHAFFVIGGAKVAPAPDAVVTLALGNGPDAVRLHWPDGSTETVGWGALAFPEYFCSAPARDAPAGSSLARVPDDADLGSDSLDFRISEPTPGQPNVLTRDLSVLAGTLRLAPEAPPPNADAALRVSLLARGSTPIAAGEAALTLSGDALAESLALALPAFAPGETLRVNASVRTAAAGVHLLRAQVRLAGDARASDDADSLRVRIGAGALELSEIQFHPALGEGEWLEVHERAGLVYVLGELSVTDRSGTRGRVSVNLTLAPDARIVLAQHRDALLAAVPQLDSTRVFTLSPWPSLNDRDGADGTADALTLRDGDGLVLDSVAYSSASVAAGAPLEKVAGEWVAGAGAPGTPGAPPRLAPPAAAALRIAPRRVVALGDEVRVGWTLPWATARVTLELYDLAGHRAAVWLDDVAAGREEERALRADVPAPGVYVAVLRARGRDVDLVRTAALRVLERVR